MRGPVAKVLISIAKNDEIKTKEIEDVTGLRLSQVSIAVKKLKSKDWISEKYVKKEGRGRPENSYSLKVDLNEIISEIIEDERRKIKGIKDNLKKINELVSELYE